MVFMASLLLTPRGRGSSPAAALSAGGLAIALCAAFVTAQPLTRPAAKPAAAAALADPPPIKIALEDLCQFRLQDGRLVFGTRMPFNGTIPRPVEVDGLAGETKVAFRRLRFQLDNEHETAGGTRVTLRVERRSSYFRLERTTEAPAGGQTVVVFTQTHADDNTGRVKPGQVRLGVTSLGEILESVEAADFQALRKDEPRAFYRYLVPALRDLRADAALAVDPWAARQVLAERLPPERVPAAVAQGVAQLGDRSFKVRERAKAELAAMGPAAMDELRRLDRGGLSPEQSTAIDVVLKRHQPLTTAEADALRDNVDFLLDCLYSDDRDVPPAALARLRKLTGREIPIDLASAPPASRAAAVEALRAELTAKPTTRPAADHGGAR